MLYDHADWMVRKGGRKNFTYLTANSKGEVIEKGDCLLDKDELNVEEKSIWKVSYAAQSFMDDMFDSDSD